MVLGFSPHLSSLPLIMGCLHPLSPDHLLQRFTAYHLMQGQSLSLSLSLEKPQDRDPIGLLGPNVLPWTTWLWPVGGLSKNIATGQLMGTPGAFIVATQSFHVSRGHAQPGPGAQDGGQGARRWVEWVGEASHRGWFLRTCWKSGVAGASFHISSCI